MLSSAHGRMHAHARDQSRAHALGIDVKNEEEMTVADQSDVREIDASGGNSAADVAWSAFGSVPLLRGRHRTSRAPPGGPGVESACRDPVLRATRRDPSARKRPRRCLRNVLAMKDQPRSRSLPYRGHAMTHACVHDPAGSGDRVVARPRQSAMSSAVAGELPSPSPRGGSRSGPERT